MPVFEYDLEKSAVNFDKHGIDFETAQRLWDDPRATTADTGYLDEDRYLFTAKWADRLWTAVFTRRMATIRIISVRRARVSEAKEYEDRAQENLR